MKNKTATLWAGTEAALSDYLASEASVAAYHGQAEPEPEEVPELLEIQGNIGVVSVKGALTNRDAWYNRLVGRTSYNAIREAVIYAAQAEGVEQILLDVDSGGGSVAGVADTSALIRMVNDRVKPVTAFTDGAMASAAYWLGSSAGNVYASKTAMVGSIGVIATHMEESEALKKAGVGVTVLRSGEYKALANGVEPLTDAARAQIQAQLDAVYKVFVQHVAEARNVSYDLADSQMAQGREFMGEAAVGAGLVDGVESFDSLFSRLSKEFIDTSNNLIDNHEKSFQQEPGMGKRALAGMSMELAAEGALGAADDTAAVEAAAAAAAELEAGEKSGAKAEDAVDETEAKPNAVTEYLQAQVKEKDAALIAAGVEVAALTKQLDDMQASHEGLVAIAAKSLSNMQVALGGSKVDATNMSAVQVLAEHKRVSSLFAEKFKAGGVAAVDADPSDKSEQAVDALTRARLNAVRTTK